MAKVFSIFQNHEPVAANNLLLKTKLYIPKQGNNILDRNRLLEKLNHALECALTVVAAPAGSGKTTLLSSWSEKNVQNKIPVAWVSIDEQDNDEIRFWSYIAAALENVQSEIGINLLNFLQTPQNISSETIITLLVNTLEAIEFDFVLVLDDFHLIDNVNINDSLSYLLEYRPRNLHLVVGSRTNPKINVGRIRAQRQLLELSLDDLRFDFSETAALFNTIERLKLSEEAISTLTGITEGWATGLQLAAISLHSAKDTHDFPCSFSAGHQHIAKYLLEEVFAGLKEVDKLFLMQISIVEQFCYQLCESLTGRADGLKVIEKFKNVNLFIISLDDNNCWYRYHHLFRDFLRTQLRYQKPDLEAQLQKKAATWFADNGLYEEAIKHYLIAKDFTNAAKVLNQVSRQLLMRGKISTLLDWLKLIPEEIVNLYPGLYVAHAWALASAAKFHGVAQAVDTVKLALAEDKLLAAEKLLESCNFTDMDLWGEIYAVHTAISAGKQDMQGTITYGKKALELLTEQNFLYGVILFSIGVAHWVFGNQLEAEKQMVSASAICYANGNIYTALFALACQGDLERHQGYLHKPYATYTNLSALMKELRLEIAPVVAKVQIGLGWIKYEWNRLDETLQHMQRAMEIGQRLKDGDIILQSYLGILNALRAQGEINKAFEVCENSKELVFKYNIKSADAFISSIKVQLSAELGTYDAMEKWIVDTKLSCTGELDNWRTFDYLAVAHMYIVQGKIEKALSLIGSLLVNAKKLNRFGDIKWILLVKALALYANGDMSDAVKNLGRALKICVPDENIMLIIQYGKPMRNLLLEYVRLKKLDGQEEIVDVSQEYIEKLVASFRTVPKLVEISPDTTNNVAAFEALSEREIHVLKLLAKGMTNKEIATKLTIGLNTVKTHTKNIYAKLGANNRTRAVEYARKLKLI